VSSLSTNPWWARLLLLLHLVWVAASIVLVWPSLHDGDATKSLSALGSSAVFLVLLFVIGASSARIGGGYVFRRTDWAVHAIWNLMMTWSYIHGWGPFGFRPQPLPGSLEGFGSLETWYHSVMAIRLAAFVVLYSGIPIGLSFLAGGRIRPTYPERARLPMILSIVSFGAAVLATLLFRFVWHGTEGVAGLVVSVLLVLSFGIAWFFAARGDNRSTRLLLCEAGLFGLLRFV
jgi:hypothetical protein